MVNDFEDTNHLGHLDHFKNLEKLSAEHSNESVCVYAYGKEMLASDCEQSYPCGVCRIQKKKTYYLKGLTSSETGNDGIFDSQFYLDGYKNGKPLFR